jgi:hypothetical protein
MRRRTFTSIRGGGGRAVSYSRRTAATDLSAAVDWRFAPKWDVYSGIMFTQVNDGLAFGFLQRNNIAPTAGLRFRF